MVIYLEDAVEITPELKKLVSLVRKENSLSQTSRILELSKVSLCSILNEDPRYKTVHEHVVNNAVSYLKKQKTEEELCRLLGVDDLESAFFPVKSSEREELIQKANEYCRKKGISKAKFHSELCRFEPDFHIARTTFVELLASKYNLANIRALRIIKDFLEENYVGLENQKLFRPDEIRERVREYIKKKSITMTHFTRRLIKFHPGLGSVGNILSNLNGTKGRLDQGKMVIIDQYLSRKTYKICSRLRGRNPGPKIIPTLENQILRLEKNPGDYALPQEVFKRILGCNGCLTLINLKRQYPKLFKKISEQYPDRIDATLDRALSLLSPEDFYEIAGRYNVDTFRLSFLVEGKKEIESRKYTGAGKIKTQEEVVQKLERNIHDLRTRLEMKIMKKIYPAYSPSPDKHLKIPRYY